MAAQRARKYFRPFDPEINPIILDRGNRRLRYACCCRQLTLAHFLEFAGYPNRFTHGQLNLRSRFAILRHYVFFR